jgi:hypothetical protein
MRCCYWEFYTTAFELPSGVVVGNAKVSVILQAPDVPIALTTTEFEVPVVTRPQESDQVR